ncbi:sodium-translocating pyrophosphatase [Blastopirellula sp. JC732]|uniref:Putative K(+)-stimulated pyrophosphate-energized sodium pump n=1 Tax=Blastopirellula sediminis TaxID=2894196 RepID=A0A9X1SKM6_9BACT|nr:sodium-translocating pyrophosphatase [Blastopirellula sediminis]MCC9606779.1 sodium-translocating pyrophosphatase [Blastopirellula sediminis]MCC9629924.1 sodium-translocating pyrophosphatase [Blastopirellula sediminis]
MQVLIWLLVLLAALAALTQAYVFFMQMLRSDPGTARMQEIASFVREGADAYLTQQYRVVAIFFVVIFAMLAALSYVFRAQSDWVPFAFVTGGFFSGLAGWIGMKTATAASSRTSAGARISLNQGLQVAFRSGAVMGLTVVGLGLLDITIWFAVLRWVFQLSLIDVTVTMLCFGMGASCQALFARVGGGIFTKAADVGADLVGKVEQGIPEDDPRNPASIADNVGDNVGDVAGMGADLYESYCGSLLATAALGVAAFSSPVLADAANLDVPTAQFYALFLPLAIAAAGILLSIAGVYMVQTEEGATQKNLLAALGRGINFSTGLVAVASIFLTMWLMPKVEGAVYMYVPGVALSIFTGLAAGWLIGKWTEYSTSDEFEPTKKLADQAITGPATIIIGGIADGMMSVWAPVIVIAVATLVAFGAANGWRFSDPDYFALGLYGVGIAAVGMLSTLGITLATDAYGPIADNAGGNAEMSGLESIVRERTDALDSLGNTTAATGKGFAIGSAALTALALLAAYVEEVRIGFERWGDNLAHVIDADQPYRVSSGFLIYKTVEDEAEHVHGFLALPADRRDKRVAAAWNELDFSHGPVKVPAEMITVEKSEGHVHLKMVGRDTELLPVHTATLIDFTNYYEANLMNPKVLGGMFVGAMATFVFCALTMKAVGRAAKGMVEEVRRQFQEKPGIMDGSELPDYASPVEISTKAAQWEMVLPSVLGLATPIVIGFLLGVGGVLGLLVGTLTTGFCLAIFMANSGGAWDNAKKYIEAGSHGGKGSPAHKAAVVGDTVGDPFKDTSGPSLNILIKLMSMVSVVVAGFVVRYSLMALGVF